MSNQGDSSSKNQLPQDTSVSGSPENTVDDKTDKSKYVEIYVNHETEAYIYFHVSSDKYNQEMRMSVEIHEDEYSHIGTYLYQNQYIEKSVFEEMLRCGDMEHF
jgi:CMP-2-keto-3-deoxyoctulosonic acid synthetase